ncbi:MAG TPA: DUF58 domain-containing protein [Candidatus Omnitrophota bacterium]|nr:DUF58 domain-containing protein [Candidatus Omnitrophota bacterium]
MKKNGVKRRVLAGIVIIFTGILALRVPIPFFNFLFWFFLGSLFMNMAAAAAMYHGARVTVKRTHPVRVDEGDLFEVTAEIENTGFVPAFNIIVEDILSCAPADKRLPRAAIDYLPAGYPVTVHYGCVCEMRGRYELGPCTLIFSDFLGLIFFTRVVPALSVMYVYPRMFRIKKFPQLIKGTAPWFGIGATRSSGGDDEFFGTRDYRPRDPIRSIHWISTARKNRLIVKEFQQQNFYRATLVFNLSQEANLGEGKETVSEYIIRIAASVSRYLLDNDIAVEVVAHTGEIVHIPSNKGGEHLGEILKFLTLARPESNVSIAEIFKEFIRFIPDDSNLIVIMPDRDWETFLTYATAGRRNISLFPFILLSSSFITGYQRPETLVRAKIRFAQQLELNPFVFSAGDDLEYIFSE